MGVVHGGAVSRMANCPAVVDTSRVVWRALAGAACVLLVAGACSSDEPQNAGQSGDSPDAAAATGPGDTGEAGESGDTGEATGPFATGRRTFTLVDAGRTTDEVPGVSPARLDRTIEVEVVYPAEGEPGPEPAEPGGLGGAAVDDAPPADGEFPLVVFAHGFNGLGQFFRGYAEGWARAGYVVALPTFPLSRNGVSIAADFVNQPGDVSFVIDELSALDEDDPLAGRIDVENIAVGGHSLGGVTVLGAGYNSCCVDERIDATIQVAGGPLPYEGGEYEGDPGRPMMLVHGTADATVPIAIGDAVFETFAPVWYLRIEGATHSGVFGGAAGELFDEAALAFLAAELRGDDAEMEGMPATVEASGIAEWRVRTAPS
jgi:dienelactone hydrolase